MIGRMARVGALLGLAAVVQAAEIGGLQDIAVRKDFRAMRASSTDPNFPGNGDARRIEPGQTLTLAELEGPGRIAHIWFTISAEEPFYGKLLVLRMWWDGEDQPSVESPLNDFFCQGHGQDLMVNSMPFRVTSEGRARSCYWPMPFAKSARLTVTNEGTKPVHAFYFYVDWQKLPAPPKDELYFHASYRQAFPCTPGDYLILDAEGSGHYVGCNLSIRQRDNDWWGEGDDRFYIDGEEKPSLQGTGSEDYFCDAWGIRKADGLFYGFPAAEDFLIDARHTNYRFHIPDPVPFTKSLKVFIEHTGPVWLADGRRGYGERGDDYSSVAYWYQAEPHKALPVLPKPAERLYPMLGTLTEGEALLERAKSTGGKAERQAIGFCSAGAQLFFKPEQDGAAIAVPFTVPETGIYIVIPKFVASFDYGSYQPAIDGKPAGPVRDLFSPDVKMAASPALPQLRLEAGDHELGFAARGKNPASKGYYLGLDAVQIIRLPQKK